MILPEGKCLITTHGLRSAQAEYSFEHSIAGDQACSCVVQCCVTTSMLCTVE